MLNQNLLLTGDDGYNLTNSLRFRSSASAYLNRTPAGAGNRRTFTWSGWVKRGKLGSIMSLFYAGTGASNNFFDFYFNQSGAGGASPTDALEIYSSVSGQVLYYTTQSVRRDPSGWYHIVLAIDTTQSNAGLRLLLWVNGVQLSDLSGITAPPQNQLLPVNNNVAHSIGSSTAPSNYFDGYLTEVNFIDGQALTPSSFGETDVLTGVWKPKKYAGTYGTNGFYLPFEDKSTASFAGSFNGSNQFLSLAQDAAFSFGTGDFTIETWINANSWRSDANPIISLGDGAVGGGSPVYTGWSMRYDTSNGIGFYRFDGGETFLTSGAFLSTGQWHHIAVSRSGGTLRMFANGRQVYSASNTTSYNNVNANTLKIGGNWVIGGGVVTWVNGQISNTRVVKGTGLYTANFTPAISNLTAVSGTSLLTLQNSSIVDNSTNAFTITNNNSVTTSAQNPFASGSVASDQSGNGNNWLPNNINVSSAGATYDSMTDVPTLTSATTANYCVMNPLNSASSMTPSGGNLNVVTSGVSVSSVSTIAVNSGKWYCEITIANVQDSTILGIAPSDRSYLSGAFYSVTGGVGYYQDGTKFISGSQSSYGASYTTNDVIGIALDMDAGTVAFYKNNTSQGTAASGLTGGYYFAVGDASSGSNTSYNVNFGQRPFTYTPPTGFVALNTFNLPNSTIVAGNKQMDAITYTGNGTTQNITTANFQPDWLWVKERSEARSNLVWDSVRGSNLGLITNTTSAESAQPSFTGFLSNGFGVSNSDSSDITNKNAQTYVGWIWKANGTAVTNTAGSITSQVSANTSAGFSIVTYTGTGASATVGHGLGVAPKMIIVKDRTSTNPWVVYHASLGVQYYTLLNATSAADNSLSNYWSATAPSSTVFGLNSYGGNNQSSSNMVAYCFAEVAGYSKFGSYTGNGSTDGTFVYTGFRPAFLMVKRSNASVNWYMFDNKRNTYNAVNLQLSPNLSNAEASEFAIDFLSNGFKLRIADSFVNGSGDPNIYMAFAENPFKNSLAR